MTLEPGDVIITGTPPGVGPLAAGQVVTVDGRGRRAAFATPSLGAEPGRDRRLRAVAIEPPL